jgi:hypothetical protein
MFFEPVSQNSYVAFCPTKLRVRHDQEIYSDILRTYHPSKMIAIGCLDLVEAITPWDLLIQ